jgi:uncharacterized protein GlcG (DUF336 family)
MSYGFHGYNEVTLEMSEKMFEAAERWASLAGFPCSIAVVDRTGAVLAFHAMDGTEPWSADIAINKAFSAVYTNNPTCEIARRVDPRNYTEEEREGILLEPYNVGLLTQARGRLIFIPGGDPIRDDDGNVIGAVGVSGFPDSVGEISDTTCTQAGISALYD